MISTLDVIGAFILGGLLPFGTIGALAGYYWARGDVRQAVFLWLHDNWLYDYRAVYEQGTTRAHPYSCARCLTPCNDHMKYCPGCGDSLDAYSTE